MNSNTKLRRWCFTAYEVKEAPEFHSCVRGAIWQLEKCPKTGKLHFQGYVEFTRGVTMKQCQTYIGKPKCHVEKAGGSKSDNEHYCGKLETRIEGPWRHGELGGNQGERNDLKKVAQDIKERGLQHAIDEAPTTFIRYHRGMEKLADHYVGKSPSLRDIKVIVLYGPSGTGKTWEAMQYDPELYSIPDPVGGKLWFDNYRGQKTILLDDFRSDWQIGYSFMLKLLDKYPIQLPVKGGHVWAHFTTVFITTNEETNEWFPGRQDISHLQRRITKFRYKMDRWEGP